MEKHIVNFKMKLCSYVGAMRYTVSGLRKLGYGRVESSWIDAMGEHWKEEEYRFLYIRASGGMVKYVSKSKNEVKEMGNE